MKNEQKHSEDERATFNASLADAWTRLTGSSAHRWLDLVHPDDRSRIAAEWEAAQSRGAIVFDFRVMTPNGTHERIKLVAIKRQGIVREWWHGRITRVEADRPHVCAARYCYCEVN